MSWNVSSETVSQSCNLETNFYSSIARWLKSSALQEQYRSTEVWRTWGFGGWNNTIFIEWLLYVLEIMNDELGDELLQLRNGSMLAVICFRRICCWQLSKSFINSSELCCLNYRHTTLTCSWNGINHEVLESVQATHSHLGSPVFTPDLKNNGDMGKKGKRNPRLMWSTSKNEGRKLIFWWPFLKVSH